MENRMTPPRIAASILFACALPAAHAGSIEKASFHDAPAIRLANGKMEVTVLNTGASIAGIVLSGSAEKLNPLWDPIRLAREAGQQRGAAGTGHFVCVDGFGSVSKEEQAAGLHGHGEAHRRPFEILTQEERGAAVTLRMKAEIPRLRETFTRTFLLAEGESLLVVDSELRSLLDFDRPAVWAEHATIGSPFLEPLKTVVDLSATRSQTRPYEGRAAMMPRRLRSGMDFTWPNAPTVAGGGVNLRAAPANPNSIDHTTTLMRTGSRYAWVTALHIEKRLLVGWLFNPEEYPWLQTWENYPPSLRMARGLEFSSQPYDVPRRRAIEQSTMFGAPTYRWLPAQSAITSRFAVFLTEAPAGMTRIDDIAVSGGEVRIRDLGAQKEILLKTSLPLW
jgi:hypothetical protein